MDGATAISIMRKTIPYTESKSPVLNSSTARLMEASADPTIGRTVDTVESINSCILLLLVVFVFVFVVVVAVDDDDEDNNSFSLVFLLLLLLLPLLLLRIGKHRASSCRFFPIVVIAIRL